MRNPNRLSAMTVSRATKLGRYADGGGLYHQVSQSGTQARLDETRCWITTSS